MIRFLNLKGQISQEDTSFMFYDTITDKLIWHEKIQQRDFIISANNNGLYNSFLNLACDLDNNRDHIMKVIGWLAHDYKATTTGFVGTQALQEMLWNGQETIIERMIVKGQQLNYLSFNKDRLITNSAIIPPQTTIIMTQSGIDI